MGGVFNDFVNQFLFFFFMPSNPGSVAVNSLQAVAPLHLCPSRLMGAHIHDDLVPLEALSFQFMLLMGIVCHCHVMLN